MNGAKTLFFMLLMTVLLIVVGGALDYAFAGGGIFFYVFGMIAIAVNFFTYWFADSIVLRMHGARVVSPQEAPTLHALVDRLVARGGLPKPKVCIIPTHIPNAFATGRNRSRSAVAVTQGLLESLNEEELEGVLAHELAHIKHYDMLLGTIVACVVGLIAMIGSHARWGLLFFGGRDRNNNPLAIVVILFLAILAPLLAVIIHGFISRSREFAADEGGARLSGNPLGLASALRRIEQQAGRWIQTEEMGNQATAHLYFINHFSLGRGAVRLFSTHPPTEKRIERLLALNASGRF